MSTAKSVDFVDIVVHVHSIFLYNLVLIQVGVQVPLERNIVVQLEDVEVKMTSMHPSPPSSNPSKRHETRALKTAGGKPPSHFSSL